jgi:hypothetical protein
MAEFLVVKGTFKASDAGSRTGRSEAFKSGVMP